MEYDVDWLSSDKLNNIWHTRM